MDRPAPLRKQEGHRRATLERMPALTSAGSERRGKAPRPATFSAGLLIQLAGDLEDLLRRVIGREGSIVAEKLGHLAAFGHALDHFQVAWRVTRKGNLVIGPYPSRFGIVVGAEGVEATVATFVQVLLAFRDAVEVDVRRGQHLLDRDPR